MKNVGLILLVWLLAAVPTAAQPIFGGFIEANQAVRVEKNEALGDGDFGERTYPRSEIRGQFTVRNYSEWGSFFVRTDVVSDATAKQRTIVDLREAYVKLYPIDWLDIKLGRQVATWGTGDLIFANDLFAKDWQAFFTALDDTYLKPPQDLLRASAYVGGITIEVAASQAFTPDNLPNGTRVSVYNPFMQKLVGSELAPPVSRPAKTLRNGELFSRVSGYQGSYEWALYGYTGFWPTPQGVSMSGVLYHPRMYSLGGSVRGPVSTVLLNGEFAVYVSQDDVDGDDPRIANSQVRGFIGAEKSLGNDLTVSGQYYGELMLKYSDYERTLPSGSPMFDELRSTVTVRVNKFLDNMKWQLSMFGYWGISDEDWHVRPLISYKFSDAIRWTLGASAIGGADKHTMFGQFQQNSNVYMRVRYSF